MFAVRSRVTARRRPYHLAAISLAAALAATACGSSDDDDESTTASQPEASVTSPGQSTTQDDEPPASLTTVTAGIPVNTTFFTLLWGIEQGFFEREGIDLQLNADVAGPAVVPTVASGELNVGGTVWAGMIPAVAQGLPLVGIAGLTDARTPVDDEPSTEDDSALVWMADSGVTSVDELRGQTIAVPNVASLAAVEVNEIARNAGVGLDEYTLVQVDLPNAAAALRSGQVDAAYMVEPFITMLKAEAEVTMFPEATRGAVLAGMPIGALVANADWAADNPDLVAALQRAMREVTAYANEHPDEVRAALPAVLGLDEGIATALVMSDFNADYDAAKLQELADLMAEHGIIPDTIDMSQYSIPMP